VADDDGDKIVVCCATLSTCDNVHIYQPVWLAVMAILPWVGTMSTIQRAVMLCGWGIKAGMVRMWVAGKMCDRLAITGHI